MIAWLRGALLQKQAPVIVLDTNGIGYELEVPLTTFYELPAEGEQVELYVHLVVREDAQLLFGFITQSQRDLFRALIRITGVGPKVALAILSTFSNQDLAQCVSHEDVSMLTKVPGIGAKTAQRLMVDLKSALEKQDGDIVENTLVGAPARSRKADATEALIALGYKASAVSRVLQDISPDSTSEQIIRQALKTLSGRVL